MRKYNRKFKKRKFNRVKKVNKKRIIAKKKAFIRQLNSVAEKKIVSYVYSPGSTPSFMVQSSETSSVYVFPLIFNCLP